MDLDRVRSACDLTESHVRTIAARRRARTWSKGIRRAWPVAGAALAAGLSVLVVFLLRQPHPPVSSVRLVAAETAINAGASDPRVELASTATVLNGMKHARTITLAAFALRGDAQVVRTLESAAGRGARVSVVLARGFGVYSGQNAQTARELAAHGVRVHLVRPSQGHTHIKAAIVDGQVYLSDRNWTSRSADALVIHDSIPGDRILIEKAFLGRSAGNDHLWTRKADALSAEADMLATRHSRRLRVSSESFGGGTEVYRRLMERRKSGDDVLLLVARSEYAHSRPEQEAVSALRQIGVKIRLSSSNEKFAIDGEAVWMGSANATAGLPNQLDFGMVVTSGAIAERLTKQFDREWDRAVAP
jgi:hypothetical protein